MVVKSVLIWLDTVIESLWSWSMSWQCTRDFWFLGHWGTLVRFSNPLDFGLSSQVGITLIPTLGQPQPCWLFQILIWIVESCKIDCRLYFFARMVFWRSWPGFHFHSIQRYPTRLSQDDQASHHSEVVPFYAAAHPHKSFHQICPRF